MIYKDLEHQRRLLGDITHVTRKGLQGKNQDKEVEIQKNIAKLDAEVGNIWTLP